MIIKNEQMTQRINWIDSAKGIGILFVVIGHIIPNNSLIFKWIFSFHMPFFFFLSGFTFNSKEGDTIKSILKIFNNLILPYIFFVLVGVIFFLIIPNQSSISEIIHQIFIDGQPKAIRGGHLWFLVSLFVVQVLFVFLNKCFLLLKYAFLLLFVCISFALNANGNCFRLPFMIDSSFMAMSFFYIGNLFAKKNFQILLMSKNNIRLKMILLLVFLFLNTLFCFQNVPVNIANNIYGNPIYYLVSSYGGIFSIIIIASFFTKHNILVFIGKYSLPIFASHFFILILYAKLISVYFQCNFQIMDNIPHYLSFLGVLFVFLMCIPLSVLYQMTIKRLIDQLTVLR